MAIESDSNEALDRWHTFSLLGVCGSAAILLLSGISFQPVIAVLLLIVTAAVLKWRHTQRFRENSKPSGHISGRTRKQPLPS